LRRPSEQDVGQSSSYAEDAGPRQRLTFQVRAEGEYR